MVEIIKCKDIITELEKLAPINLAESWDNVGLLIGDIEQEIHNVMVTLDITQEVVQEAIEKQVNLIISHHPLIFNPIKKVIETDHIGSIVRKLIKNDIAVYAAHTNLDIAWGGLNDELSSKLQLNNIKALHVLDTDEDTGIGRVGFLEEATELRQLINEIKSVLEVPHIKFVGNENKLVSKVAICSGSGAEYITDCIKQKVDVYITGDIKYHEAQAAEQAELNIIDAGHFETENIVGSLLMDYLKIRLVDTKLNIFCSQVHQNIMKCI